MKYFTSEKWLLVVGIIMASVVVWNSKCEMQRLYAFIIISIFYTGFLVINHIDSRIRSIP